MVLSILDTNRESPSVIIACIRTVLLCEGPEVVVAARELRSPATLMALAQQHVRIVEVLATVLEQLVLWSAKQELCGIITPELPEFAVEVMSNTAVEQEPIILVSELLQQRGSCSERVCVQHYT